MEVLHLSDKIFLVVDGYIAFERNLFESVISKILNRKKINRINELKKEEFCTFNIILHNKRWIKSHDIVFYQLTNRCLNYKTTFGGLFHLFF